ncbi:hypothetical protein OPV22_023219 [Ensete ventricosum]|uniref:Uncharacterized protein n=1 Tax=Ensete ventricosum TaxID=4639 RepID=A0AAV8QSF9_ENSVE|nr:hypothetical protein OPV22_023219 [Ensete ventricosum]
MRSPWIQCVRRLVACPYSPQSCLPLLVDACVDGARGGEKKAWLHVMLSVPHIVLFVYGYGRRALRLCQTGELIQ